MKKRKRERKKKKFKNSRKTEEGEERKPLNKGKTL